MTPFLDRIHRTTRKVVSFALFVFGCSVSWSDIIEDFNDADLTPGFHVTAWDGSATPNADNATWNFATITDEWRYVGVTSPRFNGDAFTAMFTCQNFIYAFDPFETVTAFLKGHNFEVWFSLGLNEELFFFIDSGYNINGGYGVNSAPTVLTDQEEFPDSLTLEIEYNGPGQPINFYYTLDGGTRTQAEELTLDALPDLSGEFDFTAEFRGGVLGPFGADLDSIEITGANPVFGEGQTIHELSLEVSTAQGENNWYYRVGNPTSGAAVRDLTWSPDAYADWVKQYWYDAEGDPDQLNWADIIDVQTIGGPWLSTHNETAPRLEWESPYDDGSSAVITGTFKFESDFETNTGIIMHNGEALWQSTPKTADGEVEGFQIEIQELNQGDILTFTADGSQWQWAQFVHTRIAINDQTPVQDWSVF